MRIGWDARPGREVKNGGGVPKATVLNPQTMAHLRNYFRPCTLIAAFSAVVSSIVWSGCSASGQKKTPAETPPTLVLVTEVGT